MERASISSVSVADFEPHGYFNGQAYRFDPDGAIYSVREGRVVRFTDFDAFVAVAPPHWRLVLVVLLLLHGLACCVSLVLVQHYYSYLPIIRFDPHTLVRASVSVLPSLGLFLIVAFGRASFGTALSFYLLTVAAGFSWLVPFSSFDYDRDLATLSIFLSALAFALPAVRLPVRLPQPPPLSDRAVGRLLAVLMLASGLILAVASTYNYRIVALADIYEYRGTGAEMPKWLRYGCGIVVGALLPYAFAMFAARGRWVAAAIAALLLMGFYPVSLMKLALFAPPWLIFLFVLFRVVEERIAIVLSLLLPLLVGLATMVPRGLGFGDDPHVNLVFGLINFRMLAVPAISLDLYHDFFAHHPLTYFCQVSWLKPFLTCPYDIPIAEALAREYGFGSLNASAFATEGIASLGPVLAPLSALLCGIVIALANGMSRHWPQRFVILSAGVALQGFLSVPFTTMLLTNGAAVLFLLWYLTPASYFGLEE
jgi:hypothetical protein